MEEGREERGREEVKERERMSREGVKCEPYFKKERRRGRKWGAEIWKRNRRKRCIKERVQCDEAEMRIFLKVDLSECFRKETDTFQKMSGDLKNKH